MVCLDTSFLIDVLDGEEAAREIMEELDERDTLASVTPVSAAELWVGANLGPVAEYEAAAELLDSLVMLEFSRDCARGAGKLQASLKRDGEPVGFTDCMIAAIAMENDEVLVTRDSDFERISGLQLRTY